MADVKNETKVTTTAKGEVKITPPSDGKRKPHVTVLVEPDELIRDQVGGFVTFLREHAIVGLAVGFVIGTQVQAVVKQLISSFIDPLVSLLFGGDELSKRTYEAHFHGHTGTFGWGAFVYALIDFVFIVVTVYAIIKIFNLDKLDKKKDS